jgi:hypothetical protein
MVSAFSRPDRVPVGQVHVPLLHGLGHLVDAEAARGQRPRVHLQAHSVLLGAEDADLGHAAHGGDALGQHGLRVVVHP